ncbi:MAG: hypothetical protein JNM85_06410 [Chthonomonas sp.]|nr:hypothetical protein [Chthonomonas sp.]
MKTLLKLGFVAVLGASLVLAGCSSSKPDGAMQAPAGAPGIKGQVNAGTTAPGGTTTEGAKPEGAATPGSTASSAAPQEEKEAGPDYAAKGGANTNAPKPEPPTPEEAKVPAERVEPKGDFTAVVGTYEMEKSAVMKDMDKKLAAKGRSPFFSELEIKADGTYIRKFGTTKKFMTYSGTVTAEGTAIALHPLLTNGKPSTGSADKVVFNMRVLQGGKRLEMMVKTPGASEQISMAFVRK